jgi:uncharacterized membrane protein
MNWMNLQTLLTALMLPAMAIFPGVALLTARRTRPDLFFSITVEPSLRDSGTGRATLRQFSRTVILFSLIGLAATVSGGFAGLTPALGVALIMLGAVLEFGGMIAAYATARRQVFPYHVEQSRMREVAVKRRPTRPVGGWLGQSGPFVILGLAAFCFWWRWDAIPGRFPIHWDLHGRPNGWAIKSWRSVFGSVLIGTLVCLFFSLLFNSFMRGARHIHSSGPDAEKESRFLRMMMLWVLGLEYSMAAMFGFSPILPPRLMTIFVFGGLLIGVAIAVVAFRSGQGGWRLQGQTRASTPGKQAPAGDRTPDECWKWGLFYYNPADPAVWVEKRFGIGWTFNFGHPRAWFILGAILLFTAAVPVISILLFK